VVHVDGSGSTWTTSGTFDFGRYGSSTINISNGGAVTSDSVVNMGYTNTGGTQVVSIIGGGTWTHSAGADFKLAVDETATSTVTVDGSGSSLVNNDELFVGVYGDGTLDITNGGEVDVTGTGSDRVRVGYRSGATGTVTISGSDSTLAGKLVEVGWSAGSTGTVEISDGGLMVCEDLFLSAEADPNSVVKVDMDGMLALLGDGSASIAAFMGLMPDNIDALANSENIDYWNGTAWDDLGNGTLGLDVDLTYHSSGDLSGYTVLTTIPEPATFALLTFGGLAALLRRRR
jgi:T5SS/PEP-CTERM-associated repeat protein